MSTGTARREGTQNEGLVAASSTAKRETAAPVKIVGQGTLAGQHGLPFVLVSSSSEFGRVHVVCYCYEGVSRVQCDCMAAQYGKSCKHALLAQEWLCEFARKKRDCAPLRRNQKPFSLMK